MRIPINYMLIQLLDDYLQSRSTPSFDIVVSRKQKVSGMAVHDSSVDRHWSTDENAASAGVYEDLYRPISMEDASQTYQKNTPWHTWTMVSSPLFLNIPRVY
jgi:hypothetical protein